MHPSTFMIMITVTMTMRAQRGVLGPQQCIVCDFDYSDNDDGEIIHYDNDDV